MSVYLVTCNWSVFDDPAHSGVRGWIESQTSSHRLTESAWFVAVDAERADLVRAALLRRTPEDVRDKVDIVVVRINATAFDSDAIAVDGDAAGWLANYV